MKILIIMAGFFPGKKFGGPPVSVDNFCSLMDIFDCYIVTHNHDMGETNSYNGLTNGWNDRGNCKVKYLSNHDYRKSIFEDIINEIKPNAIYLQGLFQSCILPCLQLAKKFNIKVILAPRGELCAGALSLKKQKKMLYIYILNLTNLMQKVIYHSTSDDETEAIHKYLKVSYKKIYMLPNIPSIPSAKYQRENKMEGKAKIIFLSRIHPKKNLISAVQYLENVKGEVEFDIYGSIEDEKYWEKCKIIIDELPYNIKVQYKGVVPHESVHQIFSQYDALLFPTFSENYGHVIAEALVVGCPVIISDQTPWMDMESFNAGWALNLGDDILFSKCINNIIQMDNKAMIIKRKMTVEYVYKKLDLRALKKKYLLVFKIDN